MPEERMYLIRIRTRKEKEIDARLLEQFEDSLIDKRCGQNMLSNLS